ncbi:SpvB/TcaC N-terminal domain-containing protein [Flavobacterium terrisoli]|uniref:SpvB/TcaC N-terminal domain-containing protein n=1 Tax=Flavobacterium terrisoli TaxID=3242195 RepID=UPI0025430FCD|nr:SpvB/TcaC N-terminal domain-containing protein [Flavobacterium buctense]
MQNSIFSRIRKQQFAQQLFMAVMTNLMVLSPTLNYAMNSGKVQYISGVASTYYNDALFNQNQFRGFDDLVSNTSPAETRTIVTKTIQPDLLAANEELSDADTILSLEKQGIIGKSENLPIDELTDNIFSFELKSDVKMDKDVYLEYELFGLADGTQATKSINDQYALGGNIIKTTKEWTKVKERLNPNTIQKGKNTVRFTTWEQSKYQYMIRNLKLVYEEKTKTAPIVFNQTEAKSYFGAIALSGFIADNNVQKITVLGKEYPVINGAFEALVEEKAPNANLTVSYVDPNGKSIENTIKVVQLLDKPSELHKEAKVIPYINKNFIKGLRDNLALGGARLEVDSLSLEENQNISIAGLRYVDVPTLSPEMVNVTADYSGYRMLPHGNLFTKSPAKVHIKYDASKFPTGYTARDVKTFYFDSDQKKWMALEKDTLLTTANEIVSKTVHFTDFINGIVKVPESPETGSFTPTSIKDIKAAEPTTGVVSIAPPTPNNMGTVNTSFPIKLPAGRAGMQPTLSVNYSSEGGNGWMGLGWDLSIPGVSLDTRWGAPRYDIANETEIYSMGGGMLTLMDGAEYTNPHRKESIPRSAERRFYPRIEGAYALIVRHGDNPTNYWWEVTDKMGNKSFYGGHGSAVVDNAVIRTGNLTTGNITYWGLCRTEDTNGNYVEYTYENNYNISLSGQPGDGGNEFYIKEIKYTLHNSITQNNYYKVEFIKDGDTYESSVLYPYQNRADKQVNARNGVVQVTKNLLKEIKVGLFDSSINDLRPIRSYRFNYNNGQEIFFKKLLKSIAEYDASGDLFYSNTMEYEDKGDDGSTISNNNIIDMTLNDSWSHASNDITGDLITGNAISNISSEFTNHASALGSSESGGVNGGLYVGFSASCVGGTNGFTAGINLGFDYSSGGGLVSFIDINGDGLNDKVFRKNDALYFRPNTGTGFDSELPINNINNISRNRSNSFSIGGSASYGAFLGYTYNKSKSVNSTYFSDVNGDGLIDLVDAGNVMFNQANKDDYMTVDVDFSNENGRTPNPVSAGEITEGIIDNIALETIEQLDDENPPHDIVKMWTAPKDGDITISALTNTVVLAPLPPTVQNPYPTSTNPFFNDYDGVVLSIQKEDGSSSVIWHKEINPTFSSSQTVNLTPADMTVPGLVPVNKGDNIYFRVQAKTEGSYDRVHWNPQILYNDPTNELDANDLSYFSSQASEGFIVSANTLLVVNQAGPISFGWNPLLNTIPALTGSDHTYSDNITFKIEEGLFDESMGVFDVSNTYTATYDQILGGNVGVNDFISTTLSPLPSSTAVDKTCFRFSVITNSNVDWKKIDWRPTITTSSGEILYGIVDYGIFNNKINSDVTSKFTIDPLQPVTIKPVFNSAVINASSTLDDGAYPINVVVKNSNKKVLATLDMIVNKGGGNVTLTGTGINGITLTSNLTSTIFVELNTAVSELANLGSLGTEPIKAIVTQSTTPVTTLPTYNIPTGVCSTNNRLTAVDFDSLHDTGISCATNYYQDRTTLSVNPFLLKGSNYILNVTLDNTIVTEGHAAVWLDFNRSTTIEAGEFFKSNLVDHEHSFTIPIPSGVSDGYVLMRVIGGSTFQYNPSDLHQTSAFTPEGTVRDYKVNLIPDSQYSKDIYCKVGNDGFGPNYRRWGQFAYHGGIVVARESVDTDGSGNIDPWEVDNTVTLNTSTGEPIITARYGFTAAGVIIPIDESVLETANDDIQDCIDNNASGQAVADCIQQDNSQNVSNTRFITLSPEGKNSMWHATDGVNVQEEFFSTSRFGVKNLQTIFIEMIPVTPGTVTQCTFPTIRGVNLINKGEGHSIAAGFDAGGVGGSGNYSTSFNWAELNYLDLNGDRYPDILTRDKVQFTNLLGAIAEERTLNFGRVTTSTSESWGATASGTFVTSKTCDPKYNIAWSVGSVKPTIKSPDQPQTKSSIGISGSVGGGANKEALLWLDMNGDGLVDRVNAEGGLKVRLNLGYGFGPEQTWASTDLKGKYSNFAGGAGFSYGFNAFSAGITASSSKAYTEKNLMDINGDGLLDLLTDSSGGNFTYALNTGNGFAGSYNNGGATNYINRNRSTAEGANGSFTIPICILGLFQININPKFGGEQSLSRDEITIQDINGDGFADILTAGNGNENSETGADTDDGELHARLSKIGKTNLLKKVNTPTGGSWEVAYSREGNIFEMPHSQYVLSTIAVYDGFTADNSWDFDRALITVEYEDPYYDRRERDFFGFKKVKVEQREGYNNHIDIYADPATITDYPAVYRYTTQEFHNDNYYLKGAVKKESLFAGTTLWTESITSYGIYRPGIAINGTEAIAAAGTFDPSTSTFGTTFNADAVKYGSTVDQTATINGGAIPSNGFVCTDLDHSSLFVAPLATIKHFTEGGSGDKYIVTATEAFDAFGNITQYRDYGEQNTDAYVTKITYYPASTFASLDNAVGYPEFIRVYESNGSTVLRERKAIYYPTPATTGGSGAGNTGQLHQVITKLNDIPQYSTMNMDYDDYGNMTKIVSHDSVDPNVTGSHYFKQYTYDTVLNMFPIRIEDAFGYFSKSEYNFLFGMPVYNTDMNQQSMRTRIDDRGRAVEITGPYELFLEGIAGGAEPAWTIRFEYQNEVAVATSVANFAIDQYGPNTADFFNGVIDAEDHFDALSTGEATNSLHHALTRHFDPEYRTGTNGLDVTTTNQILTATLVDGFGKPVQVKKSMAVFDGTSTPSATIDPDNDNTLVWVLNGKTKTDGFNRAIESYYSTTQFDDFSGLTVPNSGVSFVPPGAFNYNPDEDDTASPTEATYDVLDRSLTSKLPGETDETTTEFTIDSGIFLTKVTNEFGQVQKKLTDARGRIVSSIQESVTGNVVTNFEYNSIGELLKVTDVAGNITETKYDLAGRRIELRHPDNGITKFTYDLASNLKEKRTSNLLESGGQAILYNYTYNRLDEIIYPQFPENNVHYYYGPSGNSDASNDNAVGKLWYHVDATGTQYFKYGKLGEITKNRRSVVVPGDRTYWFQTDWTYDTWNRVQTIQYPDEELVTYRYNRGGELHAMTSEKNGVAGKNIISQLGYDRFGQRNYLRYGNGTETSYSYEAERRRLDRMKVQQSGNSVLGAGSGVVQREFINNQYSYDVLGNITAIHNNTVAMPTPTQIGGRSWQTFTYDDLNRMTTSAGNFVGRNENGVGFNHSKYTLAMSYDSQHNIKTKTQIHETATSPDPSAVVGAWTQVEQTTYGLDYQEYNTAGYSVSTYDYEQPHAPRKIVEQPVLPGCCDGANDPRVKTKSYEYDYNGNQTKVTEKICTAPEADIIRENLWDEENRLRAIDLNPEATTVHPIGIYTYDAGGERIIKQNSSSVAVYENAEQVGTVIQSDFMLYPSGMLVARPATDNSGVLSYTKHYFAGSQRVSSKIGTTTNLGRFLDEWALQENSSGGAPINLVGTSHDQLTLAETGVTHVYTAFEITPTPIFASNTAFITVPSFEGTDEENEQFFFHPDHLGSSNYITNFVGEVSQHMEYFAFGESFVEEHMNSHNSPYKFNGKELDEESGLYYYGARYYDPKISIWASVDPLVYDDTFWTGNHNGGFFNPFNHGSYMYCYQNPVRLIDPNGKQVDVIDDGVAGGTNVVNDINADVSRPAMGSINGVVLHRTVSSSATSAINSAKANKGKAGFHIVIDTNGETTQLVNFNNRANHVGKQKGEIGNFNSIGIEVVGNYNSTTETWDALTEEQIEATAMAVFTIMTEYNLTMEDIYPHEDVSWKTAGEGQTVIDAIHDRLDELVNPPPPPTTEKNNDIQIKERIPETKKDGIIRDLFDMQKKLERGLKLMLKR